MASALPGYHAHYSLNRDPQNARFRGGRAYGVVTYWKESLGPAIAAVPDWDREGRVVFSRFETFAIANVYAVNGTSRPYFDHALGRFAGDRHAFKRCFQRMILEHAAKLSPIILAGDWNVSQASIDTHPRLRTEEPHARARAEFRDLVESRLVDVYRHLHPKAKGYSWFNRRSRTLDAARVDFLLVSKDLVPITTSARIFDDPRFRMHTDHAPIGLIVDGS
jgi:exodeoxyribonuclease III